MLKNRDQSYNFAFAGAVFLHVALLVLLCLQFISKPSEMQTASNVNIIKAFSVSESSVNAMLAQVATQKAAEQSHLQAQLQAQQQEQLQAQEQAAAQQQAVEQAHLNAIKQQQQEIAKTKLAAEIKQQTLTLATQEAAALKQAQADAKAAAAKKMTQALKNNLQSQLSKESAALKAASANAKTIGKTSTNSSVAQSAATTISSAEQAEIDKYKALIIQTISQEWIVPDSVDKNAVCKLVVKVAPGGIVLDVQITQPSGNPLLDQSARNAVLKASPLPVPKDAAIFDNFRLIQLTVKPESIESTN